MKYERDRTWAEVSLDHLASNFQKPPNGPDRHATCCALSRETLMDMAR